MADTPRLARPDWEQQLHSLLPLYGHRNWIVVADSAYPAQSKPGIETIVSGSEQLAVARRVLDAINASRHVRANIYLDRELDFIAEADAPGVSHYREQLKTLFAGADPTSMLPSDLFIFSGLAVRLAAFRSRIGTFLEKCLIHVGKCEFPFAVVAGQLQIPIIVSLRSLVNSTSGSESIL